MAWTTPKTWSVGELVTAALVNTHLRDNLNAVNDLVTINAAAMINDGGSPSLQGFGQGVAWLLDSASDETVKLSAASPRDWATADIILWWVNAGAGSGDVRWQIKHQARSDGEATTSGVTTTDITITAGSQNNYKKSTVVSGASLTDAKLVNVTVMRNADDAADTLGNDVGLVAVELRRAS